MAWFAQDLPEGPCFGALAEFAGAKELHRACLRVRDAGYARWDAYSPFPVHGLPGAMGLRRSILPRIVLATALGAAAGGFGLQWWVHARAYPLVISGKPLVAWQAYVPITFELGVLGGALGAVLGMFALCRLPMHWHPLFGSTRFERVTDDGFFIAIEAGDPGFDPVATVRFLESLGAARVELVES